MTWVIDAILAAVLVGLVWLGAKRGLMKSLAGVISVGAAFFGASWCANRFVTPVSRWLEPLLRESIQQQLSGQDGADAGELLSAFAFDAHSLEKILEDVAQRVKETGESVFSAVRASATPSPTASCTPPPLSPFCWWYGCCSSHWIWRGSCRWCGR